MGLRKGPGCDYVSLSFKSVFVGSSVMFVRKIRGHCKFTTNLTSNHRPCMFRKRLYYTLSPFIRVSLVCYQIFT